MYSFEMMSNQMQGHFSNFDGSSRGGWAGSTGDHIERTASFDQQWQEIVEAAGACGVPIEVTVGYVLGLFKKQGGRCAISGLPIELRQTIRMASASVLDTAFLGRIDPSQGYIYGNICWLHRDVGKMKLDLPVVRLLELCRMITERSASSSLPELSPPFPPSPFPDRPTPLSIVTEFRDERTESDRLHSETSLHLWQSFQEWCRLKDRNPGSRTAFGIALRKMGYQSKRDHVVTWYGLRLLPREGARVIRGS